MKIDPNKLRILVKSSGLTNTRLAVQAGITRQSLQAMLRGNHVVEVREKTGKGLAQALQLPDESLLSPDPLVGYKEAVAEDPSKLSESQRAKYPLKEARVEVQPVKGRPGWYEMKAWLLPHLHLEGITAAMHLVSQMPARKG